MEPQWSLPKQKPPTSTHAANISTTKNYRAIYDPDLDRGPTKQASEVIYRYEDDTNTRTQQDPRLQATNYGKGLSKGQKSYRNKLIRVRYQHDEYSLESESLTTVLLTNLSPLTSEAQIATYLSVYGQVDRVEIKRHPATGGSLGIALVVFGDHGQAAATKAIGDGTRKMGQASNVQIKYDPTGEKLKAAIAESSNNMNESTNMDDHTAKPTLVSGRTATLSPPPPPVDSYSKRTYGSTYRYDADHVDRETSRWSKYDDNYRYQQHSREYSDRRYYNDDRYRGSSSLYNHPSSSPSSHPPYNHDLDRYFSTSRSSSSFYGTPPPMPPGTSKWDQSKQTPSSGSAAIYSTYNSRRRSRSPSRGAGRRDISRGRYEGGYSSKHRMAYDSTNWDRDWERRRKPSDSWTASARDDSRQSREERRPSSTENQTSLMISRKNLPFVRGVLEELRKAFYPHRYLDIYHDENAWFIVFDSITVAKRALTAMEGQSLLGYDLHITLQNSSATTDSSYPSTTQALSPPNRSHDIPTPLSEATPSSTSPKLTDDDLLSMTTSKPNSPLATEPVSNTRAPDNTTSTTTVETSAMSQQMHAVTSQPSTVPKYTNVRDHAKQILLDQLSDVFLKDLKNRLVGPCIYDFLNPALHKNRTSNKRLDSTSSISTNGIKDEPLPLPSSLSTDTDTAKASDQTSTNDQPTVSTSSETKAVMTAPIMNEEEELFGLPKPEENFAEGTLPSLNKLPKFKKRTNRSSVPQENGTLHTRKRLHQRISSPPPKRPCDDNSNLVVGDNHMDRLNGNRKSTDYQKKQPSTTPTESDTSSPPILPTTEKSAGANFFSNSEDDGGSLAATAYQSTDDEKQRNEILGRKKQRRVRNVVSSDDDEGNQDHHAHETFLRQLHKTATINDDQTDVKTEAMKINGDMDMDLDDYGQSETHKKRSKLKKRHKRINEQQQHESLDDSVSVSSNINKGENKLKKGTLSPWKQRKLTEVTKNNKGSDLDIDIGGTSDDEVDTHLRQPKQHQQHLYDENGMATGDEDDEDKKLHTMMTHPESNELDQEAYERMLLEPDSSSDEDEKMDYGGNEQVNDLDLHPDWDPFRLVQDGEDFGFLRLAILEKLGFGANIPEMDKVTEKVGGGCARSRGYSVISDAEKATYLPKNMAVVDDTASLTTGSSGGVGRLTSSRANRVNNRRFVVGMVMQKKTMADSDILKFNQLKGRKKHLRFAKSPIHDWGLYAEEHIDANDMVIEYVGEVIRQQVAEEREKIYERCGIGSSYLFRVDDDIVIDATKKGSIARFINHCCSPNCSAKIITVDKQKKIVIYANRDIEPGEEITYDYKFPLEDDKIPCLCGSKYCKGTLN